MPFVFSPTRPATNATARALAVITVLYLVRGLALGAAETNAKTAAPTVSEGADPAEIPLPPIKTAFPAHPGPADLPVRHEMPNVLTFDDGDKVTSSAEWSRRRAEMKRTLAHYATGHMPPAPGNLQASTLSSERLLDGTVLYRVVRLTFGPERKLELHVGIFTPIAGAAAADTAAVKGTSTSAPAPAVIMPVNNVPGAPALTRLPQGPGQGTGVNALLRIGPASAQEISTKAASSSASTAAFATASATTKKKEAPRTAADLASGAAEALKRGYAYVIFNHNECGEDTTLRERDGSWSYRTTRFYPAYPEYDWGLLAGWAWGVSRIVDYLETDTAIDKTKIILSGVSRTGKSAMVAAAFDDRIAMVAPCVTGGGGMPAYRFSGVSRGGKEGLGDMLRKYPNWFSPHLRAFWGHTDKLPFDQHWFVALVAPRPFLALEGLTDQVSAASGVKQSYQHAKPAYTLLGAADKLGVNYANHGHTFNGEDWSALLDFADKHLRGKATERRFDQFPPEAN